MTDRLSTLLLFSVATACSSNNTTTGERADGLAVECEDVGDETYVCEPQDGDDECESWDDGGPAFVLWPPNHKMVSIDASACLALIAGCDDDDPTNDDDDLGDLDDFAISGVTADEAVEVGAGGDGNTAEFDVTIVDGSTVELRAERQGGGDGRVYRIEFENLLGDIATCEVHVPHNKGPHGGAIDSGEVVRVEL